MYYFYLFRCKDGSLYSGSTNNLEKRSQAHNSGTGAAYTRARGGGTMVYHEAFDDKSQAMRREWEVKKWPRSKKLKLLNS